MDENKIYMVVTNSYGDEAYEDDGIDGFIEGFENNEYNYEKIVVEIGNKTSVIEAIYKTSQWGTYFFIPIEEWEKL